ncbi:MAG: serine hydroxymethyltransferase [Candidatus Dojkabacteria bacterium]
MLHPKLQPILDKEIQRQLETLDLIPSENFTSRAVREAVGSVFMHKYSEGYPGARYYEGNEFIDELELLTIDMVKKVFTLPIDWSANVQPLAGSNANLGVYNALLNPGDKILSMYLPDGGHLSHGWSYTATKDRTEEDMKDMQSETAYRGGKTKVSIVSKIYNVTQYKVNKETNLFDYDAIEKLALEIKPKLIVTGGTAYTREIDYKRMKSIAEKIGAYYMADVAHEAGLIAAGVLTTPIGIADVVTFTTHKTLRGPKGAVIVAKNEIINVINKAIMPGMQGGPHNGTIAGICQALFEADTPEFKEYAGQIVKNAKALEVELKKLGFNLVSGGTDKHLLLIDLRNKNISGKDAAKTLAKTGIISNMNTIPYESGSPLNPSGLRIGTPTLTTRGMKEAQMKEVANLINEVLLSVDDNMKKLSFEEFNSILNSLSDDKNSIIYQVRLKVSELCKKYPLTI